MRLYICNSLIGFGLSAIFTGLVLWLDVAGIGHLVQTVHGGWLAALVFFVLNGIVYAGVQTGIVVMSMDYGEDPPGGTRVPQRVGQAVPVPLAPVAQKRRR